MRSRVQSPFDLEISGDIEAYGPIPGPYSMLSFGLGVVGRYVGEQFTAATPFEATSYAELRPSGDRCDPGAPAVSGRDRDALPRDGRDPAEATDKAATWVGEQAGDDRPVLVGFPRYDSTFFYWYFERNGSPVWFSPGLNMKTT